MKKVRIALTLISASALSSGARSAVLPDPPRRTAIISAYSPELEKIEVYVRNKHTRRISGLNFVTGSISGQPVVLLLSGISMTNAAIATQMVIDRFRVSRILFSGIAGGVDPRLSIGDVVVPDRWAEYLEGTFARANGQGFVLPDEIRQTEGSADLALGHFNMFYPRSVQILHGTRVERKLWFSVDPGLLALARRTVTRVKLSDCFGFACLRTQPHVVVGGRGISASVFMDNAQFRSYMFEAFHAEVLDMETAAVAHAAYENGIPFLAFRSLSDLAGGDASENQEATFFQLASTNAALVLKAFLTALPDPSG